MACDAARWRRRYGFEGSLIDRAWTRSWGNMMVGIFLVETVIIIAMNYGTNDERAMILWYVGVRSSSNDILTMCTLNM